MDSYLNINLKTQRIVSDLLKACKKLCYNNVSDNIRYIKLLVKEKDQQLPLIEIKKRRYKKFIVRDLLTIDELTKEIEKYQSKIIWVDFILYFSSEKETIILVEFIFGGNNTGLSFHASIIIPPESITNNSMFDLNWHLSIVDEKLF